MSINPDVLAALRTVSTATVHTLLSRKGIRRTWLNGPKPLKDGQPRVAGPAFTLRFIPMREDIKPDKWTKPTSTRHAIDEMPKGAVVVVDAQGITSAGTFGDNLVTLMKMQGAAALITDGAVRDKAALIARGQPLWCAGFAAPGPSAEFAAAGWQEPIGCGGIAIMPNDIMIADDDGAVVVPAALAEEIARIGVEHEEFEAWVISEAEKGEKISPNEAARARYEALRQKGR
jgi:regulator of RNase E activity RraA